MLCPVCNGIVDLQVPCLSCGGTVTDCGRLSDWTGPYAPYEPADVQAVSSASLMQSEAGCCHAVYCSSCQQTSEAIVTQWE